MDLAYWLDDELPTVFIGDVTRFRQILVNFLSNAVKFTEYGEVVVSGSGTKLDTADNVYELHIAVTDTGIGIPQDRMDVLFQSFSQVDASTTRRYGGTGLGLVICKRLSELMEGRTWVESDGVPGKGSTFHVTVRLQAASQEPDHPVLPGQQRLANKRVLIVDDNGTSRSILAHQSNQLGMLPVAVASGAEALTMVAHNQPFDLAIIDQQMPAMDGLALAAKLRQHPRGAALPLILLTSFGQRGEEVDTAQFAARLTKPIKPSQLQNVLISLMTGKHVSDRQYISEIVFNRHLSATYPLRILLAEDNIVNQKVALGILERLGYRADVAANGLEVLEALKRQPYDLVLMDIQMPEMDGLEATRCIREQADTLQQPRIVAMTANALQGDRERCLSAGMDGYISKPVRITELVKTLKQVQPLSPAPAVESTDMTETTDIDLKALEAFQELMGEGGGEMVVELIELFLEDTPGLLAEMRLGVADGDREKLRRAAHSLKSSAATLGLSALSALCQGLENLGRSDQFEEATERIEEVASHFEQARAVLCLEKQKRVADFTF